MSNETKWTPGPWTLETVPINNGSGSCHKIGPFPSRGAFDITYACVYADQIRIGIDDRGGVSKVGDELAANARLISSAPDLADACQAAHDYLSAIPETAAGGDDEAIVLCRKLAAALARARGEAA